MAITREEVLHVARLARLELSDDEVTRFQEQLSAILDAVSKVSELDLARRAADLAPARDRERVGRGRAARVPQPRRGVRERARPRGRPLPDAARLMSHIRHRAGTDMQRPSLRRFRQGGSRPSGRRRRRGGCCRRDGRGARGLRRRTPAGAARQMSAGGGIDTLRLTAEDALGLLERGEVSGARALGTPTAPRSTRATASCNASCTLADEPGRRRRSRSRSRT